VADASVDAGAAAPADAATPSDTGSPSEAGATPDAGSAIDASSSDGGARVDACGEALRGPFLWLIGGNGTTGTDLYRVYPDAAHDELFAHLTANGGGRTVLSDFAIGSTGRTLFGVAGSSYYRAALPDSPQATVDLGAPLTFATPPPTLSYLSRGDGVFIGRGTTNLFRIAFDPNGTSTWLYLGDVPAPGGSCGQPRDFVSGGEGGPVFQYLAFCNGRNNAVVEATATTQVDGTPVTTSRVLSDPTLDGIAESVLGQASIAGPFQISANDLYANGVLRRPLRYCAGASVVAPIAFPRAIY
jgi:hypothetical protein